MRVFLLVVPVLLASIVSGGVLADRLANPMGNRVPSIGGLEPIEQPGHQAPVTPEGREAAGERVSVALGKHLIVPVVHGRRTEALVLFDLVLEAPAEAADAVEALRPRLRDAFLQTLFAMSHTGAFDAAYTDTTILDEARHNLRRAAEKAVAGAGVDVLIVEVLRQEL